MKKTLTIEFTRKEKQTVEVEFPIYREHDVGGDDYSSIIYARIEADGTTFEVHHTDRYRGEEQFELEVSKTHFNNASSADYYLGTGEYKSSAAAWDEALKKARAYLARFPDSTMDRVS
jgi:hypothetical protein